MSSQEGEGSTFVLRLPISLVVPAIRRQLHRCPRPSTTVEPRVASMSEATIFVVEDEPSFVDALTIGLTREGFTVEFAVRRPRGARTVSTPSTRIWCCST